MRFPETANLTPQYRSNSLIWVAKILSTTGAVDPETARAAARLTVDETAADGE